MIVGGQRIFNQGVSGVVLDAGAGYCILHDGRVLVVRDRDLVLSKSAESVERRQKA